MLLSPFARRSLDDDTRKETTKVAEKAVESGVEWLKGRFAPPPRAEEKEPAK